MNLTVLVDQLFNDNERALADAGFFASYESFKGFFQQLPGFAVYFDKANGYANTANTVFVMGRLIAETNFTGEVCLVYDKDDTQLCAKIEENLPFFGTSRYSYMQDGAQVKVPFVLCGGGEQDDPFWDTLSQAVRYVMTIRPYLDDADFSFVRFRRQEDDAWVTFPTDTILMNQVFSLRNYYVDIAALQAIPEDIKNYWTAHYTNLDKIDTILNSANTSIFPVTGLAAKNGATDRGDNCVLILALACLAKLKADGKTTLLVLTDYNKTDDPHFTLLKSFCESTEDAVALLNMMQEKYPQAAEADLRAGLLNPLLQKRTELSGVLDQIMYWDGQQSFSAGKVYLCPVGALPYDYLAALFAKSDYLFFESCDYTNLAVNLGVPYLQKSIETASRNYPDFIDPGSANFLDDLCDIFSNPISAYTSALDKNINAEIQKVAAFLQNPERGYFSAISRIAQGQSTAQSEPLLYNDKLAASGVVFQLFYAQVNGTPQRHVCFRNSEMDKEEKLDYQKLYQQLRNAFDQQKKTLNLSQTLRDMRVGAFLTDFSGGNDFVVTLDSIENIQFDRSQTDGEDEVGDIIGVNIIEAKTTVFAAGNVQLHISDWYGGDSYVTYMDGTANVSGSLLDLPWLQFSDVRFSAIVPENDLPVKGSVGGTFGQTKDFSGVNLVVDLNGQNGLTRVMASLYTPLTTLDAFGAVAGGLDFQALLPQELLDVVQLGLSALEFYYDKKKNQITAMQFTFANAASSPWILWKKEGKALLIAQPSVLVKINAPADLSNRQILLSISAFVDIGEQVSNGAEVGQLWLNASYPPFQAEMRMASESIDLDKLLALFDCQLDLQAKIIDLCVIADFGNQSYQLSAAVDCVWEITEQFAITGLALQIADKAGSFSVGFAGFMQIFDCIDVGVAVGHQAGIWTLFAKAALNEQFSMSDLVHTYLGGNALLYDDGETDNPLIADLSFHLTKSPAVVDFEITAAIGNWEISLFDDGTSVSASGTVGRKNHVYYGSLRASVNLLGADMILTLHYGASANFTLEWGKFIASFTKDTAETVAVIHLKACSIGEMIETFIGWLYGSKFSLDTPWDILNNFKFDLDLVYSFTKKRFQMEIKQKIDLGFGKIDGIIVIYDPSAKEKISVALEITYAWEKEPQKIGWDAAEPGSAPVPAGLGSDYFNLKYLALGQHVKFFAPGYRPTTTNEAISYLLEHDKPDTFPGYDAQSGMLVAADFDVLKEGKNTYFLHASLVFYDPQLFALQIKLAGAAAKILDGFSFEIIYAKLSETLGVFQSTIVLPDRLRKFDIGAFAITLPDFYIEVYTNGNFKIDVGFPKNGDFSRSFTLSGIVPPGIPVTGSAGFYFGKLSSASAESSGVHLPVSQNGFFNPAIVFGLGLRFGIGKSVDYGILSGGFSLTLSAVLEGVIAKWISYQLVSDDEQWYYYLKGTAAITGNIYGSLDLVIISAVVDVTASLSVSFVYETCRAIELTVGVYVEARISLKINFGIFKISIKFHFKLHVQESFKIGDNAKAPWDGKKQDSSALLFQYPIRDAARMDFSNLQPEGITSLQAHLSLGVTAAADEYNGKDKIAIANVLLTIQSGEDFEALAEMLIYWVIAAAYGESVNKKELDNFVVDDQYAGAVEAYFKEEAQPVTASVAEAFLEQFFAIHIADNAVEYARLDEHDSVPGVYVPLPPTTMLKAMYHGKTVSSYTLGRYNVVTSHAVVVFKELFDRLAVSVQEKEPDAKMTLLNDDTQSVAALVFCDWFAVSGHHIARSIRKNLLDVGSQALPLKAIVQNLKNKQFYDELSGIVSRFFLNGLRLPTCVAEHSKMETLIIPQEKGLWVKESGGGLILPEEAGIFALSGQAFGLPNITADETYIIQPQFANKSFHLNEGYQLEIHAADGSAQAVKAIQNHADKLSIPYQLEDVQAEFAPAVISFADPIQLQKTYIWNVPESLMSYFVKDYAAYPKFHLYFTKFEKEMQQREAGCKPLTFLEFSVVETAADGVYLIGSAAESTTNLLRSLITSSAIGHISGLSIFNAAERSNAEEMPFLQISQINLSTETRPPQDGLGATLQQESLRLLWKALVTNNGGYILTYRDAAKTKLSNRVTLMVTFDFTYAEAGSYLSLINAVSSEIAPKQGECLTAFADAYTVTTMCSLPAAEMAQIYCTDIGAIAALNAQLLLSDTTAWNFVGIVKQSGDTAQVLDAYTCLPHPGETLADFAARNHTNPAYALWLNREKPNLFAAQQALTFSVQAGCRMGAGSENTTSLINEKYMIQRPPLPDIPAPETETYAAAVLQNNYSLLRYGVKDRSENSAPYSYGETEAGIVYEITMPADRYAGGNYSAQGMLLQNNFCWLDYYGNQIAAPFYEARFVGYQDALLGLSKWQSLSASWNFKTDDCTCVVLTFSFAAGDYGQENARKCARKFYHNLLTQIQDTHVNIYLTCSMFAAPSQAIDKTDLCNKIAEILACLHGAQALVPDFTLAFSFRACNITSEALFSLTCALVIKRESQGADENGVFDYVVIDRGYEEVPNLLFTESTVSLPEDMRDFAEHFDAAWPDYMVLKGGTNAKQESAVYAYRIADMQVNVHKKETAIYLPMPISNVLLSRDDIWIEPYAAGSFGEAEARSYRAVDLNGWLRSALQFADQVLTADISSAAALTGCTDHELLEAKKKIAEKLVKLLVPAWKEEQGHTVPEEASQLFRQRMLGSLSSFYGVKSIVAMPVDVQGLPEHAVFFGSLEEGANQLSFSAPKLKNGMGQYLVFAVFGEDVVLDQTGAVLPYADLRLKYTVTHIESEITPVMDAFHTSVWHGKMTRNLAEVPLYDEQPISIPLPLYAFPEIPNLVLQKSAKAADQYQWKYAFTYSRSYHYPQQVCHCKVRYNTEKNDMQYVQDDLFSVLAQIDATGSKIQEDLYNLAVKIHQSDSVMPETELAQKFSAVFTCAKHLILSLAEAEFFAPAMYGAEYNALEEVNFNVKESNYGDYFSITLDYEGAVPQIEGYTEIPVDNHTWIFRKDENYLSYAAGQALNKRMIVMPEHNVLQYQNAIAEIYVEQNRELCGKEMNDAFVYTTGIAAFDSAYHPSCIVGEENLAADQVKRKPLSERLLSYLEGLCGTSNVVLQAQATYANPMYCGLTPVVMPIFSQTKTQILDGDFTELVSSWIKTLRDWRNSFISADFEEEGRLSFAFIFFSDLYSVPLLTVKDAYILGALIQLE